ncbi:hypothetical protein ACTD5D_21795 [Nocardia takedensis]|uniref:hypothetical protein n=1 Tax=Nocardia takedensis TaxID=259390 RepID=UPI003F76C4D9
MATRLVTAGSQLWLWNHEPRGWWPQQVLRFGDTAVTAATGIDLEHMHETGQIPSGVLGDPRPPTPPQHLEVGDLVVRALGDGPYVSVVSILDRSSPAPPEGYRPTAASDRSAKPPADSPSTAATRANARRSRSWRT